MTTLFGIWWNGPNGAQLCECYGKEYHEAAFKSRAKAERWAEVSNKQAESQGWKGGYFAAPIPQGITCHWIEDSQ